MGKLMGPSVFEPQALKDLAQIAIVLLMFQIRRAHYLDLDLNFR